MKFNLQQQLRFYAVTDRSWLNTQTLAEQVEKAVKGGITILQLREKNMPQSDFLQETITIKAITDKYRIPLIINDNLEIALKSNAAGLHIGQDDCPVAAARYALGKDKILGVSAQTVAQAIAAETDGADYLGVGAIYATPTKKDAQVVSITTLQDICQSVNIPVIAIGGLNENNIPALLHTGICGVALVSAVFAAKDITSSCRKLNKILQF